MNIWNSSYEYFKILMLKKMSFCVNICIGTNPSTFQICSPTMLDQFQSNVQTLKTGQRNAYSQLSPFSQHCLSLSSLLHVFLQLETLVLHDVHNSDAHDLLPYLSSIPLNKTLQLISDSLLNNSTKSRLISCLLFTVTIPKVDYFLVNNS